MDRKNTPRLDCQQHKNVFSAETIPGLIDFYETSANRKLKLNFEDTNDLPDSLRAAYEDIKKLLTFVPNTAILKLYERDDTYQSGAYEIHTDPPEYANYPLVLCTVTGSADLTYQAVEGTRHIIQCPENSVLILFPDIPHSVSPPTNQNGKRLFLFFGRTTDVK